MENDLLGLMVMGIVLMVLIGIFTYWFLLLPIGAILIIYNLIQGPRRHRELARQSIYQTQTKIDKIWYTVIGVDKKGNHILEDQDGNQRIEYYLGVECRVSPALVRRNLRVKYGERGLEDQQ